MNEAQGTHIIGHRGAGGHAPENTEAAILAGIRLGATAVEVDVQFTADGIPVIYHDRTLERMAGVRGRIREQTARELSGYDVGFRFGDDYRGLRILTLDEAARLVPRDVALHIEVKDYDAVSASHLKEVLGSIRRRNLLDRSLFSSFNDKILSSIHALEPKARLGLLVSGKARGSSDRAAALHCYSLHPEAGVTDRALVEECHARGLLVFPYTANDPGQMKQLLELGVDGLYTDFPARLADLVGHRPRVGRSPMIRGAKADGAHGSETRRRGGRIPSRRGESAPAVADPVGGEPDLSMENSRTESGGTPEEAVPSGPLAGHPDTTAGATDSPGTPGTDGVEPEGTSEDDPLRRKRRRGRRGGRRHRRKPSPGEGPEAPVLNAGAEEAPLALPAGEEDEIPLGEETPGDDSVPVASAEEAPSTSAGGDESDAARKRRRRGRRGGRRHRRGGGSSNPPPNGSPPGGQA